MSTPLSLLAHGTFTSDGAARTIVLPKEPSYFMIKNRSTWGTAPTAVVQSEWFTGYAAGQAKTITEGGASALTGTLIAAGGTGFTFVDLSAQAPGALVATGTQINQANPAVVLDATTVPIGTTIRLLNTTGMLQVAGMTFTTTAVNAGVSYTLGYLNSAGFAAVATNVDYRIMPAKYWRPRSFYITGITLANPAVITTSEAHNMVVGQKVRIHVPAVFGMQQMNNLIATITAIGAGTITTDINSTAFTAFAFPTSAVAAAGMSFATVCPVGEVATILTRPEENIANYGLYLDTGVCGANGNVMDWHCFTRDYTI